MRRGPSAAPQPGRHPARPPRKSPRPAPAVGQPSPPAPRQGHSWHGSCLGRPCPLCAPFVGWHGSCLGPVVWSLRWVPVCPCAAPRRLGGGGSPSWAPRFFAPAAGAASPPGTPFLVFAPSPGWGSLACAGLAARVALVLSGAGRVIWITCFCGPVCVFIRPWRCFFFWGA